MNNQENYSSAPIITLTAGKNTERLAVASFVCGIVSMVFLLLGCLGLILLLLGPVGMLIISLTMLPAFVPAFLGYALYTDARRRGSSHRLMRPAKVMCLIGIITPLAGLLLSIASCGAMVSCLSSFNA